MSGYCRVCHDQNLGTTDSLVACNNCGSLACDMHHTWWSDSKNAFCTECFPLSLVNALNHGAAGLAAMKGNLTAETLRPYIARVLEEDKLSLEDLIAILHRVSAEIIRRTEGARKG